MRPMDRARLIALCCFTGFLAACEDLPAGPDLEALVESRGRAGASGLSLQDLFAVAVVRVQRTEGADSATAVLARWRDASEMPVDGGAEALSESREQVRALEAETVLRAFGPAVVDQAHHVVSSELGQLRPAAERAIRQEGGSHRVQQAMDSADAALDEAVRLRGASPPDALVAVARAADRLDALRTALTDARRFPTLEELHAEALGSLRAAGERARADSAQAAIDAAETAARDAQTAGSVDRAYVALEEARTARARMVAEALGPERAARLNAALHEAAAELRAGLEDRQARSLDVSREWRMLLTATDLLQRADAALADDEPHRAIDLATHAAGLINELRRQLAR